MNEPNESSLSDLDHAHAWSVLPWYVNCTLAQAETARVDSHLRQCLVCRRELDALRVLAGHTAAPRFDLECEHALQRLALRLDRQPAAWRMPWASAALLTLVTGLMTWVSTNTETSTAWLRNAGYSMAGELHPQVRVKGGGPQVHLVFYDDITERELRSLVLAVGAAVVEGPTPQGVYTLAFARDISPHEVMTAIQTLRFSRGVVFADQIMPTRVSDAGHW